MKIRLYDLAVGVGRAVDWGITVALCAVWLPLTIFTWPFAILNPRQHAFYGRSEKRYLYTNETVECLMLTVPMAFLYLIGALIIYGLYAFWCWWWQLFVVVFVGGPVLIAAVWGGLWCHSVYKAYRKEREEDEKVSS